MIQCPEESVPHRLLVRLRDLFIARELQQRVQGKEGDVALRHGLACLFVNLAELEQL